MFDVGWVVLGFVERVEGRGKLIYGWAPQEKILAHASVGGFLSHCGWNSTLEALWAGKPMAAWPLAVEQRLNARLQFSLGDLHILVMKSSNSFELQAAERGIDEWPGSSICAEVNGVGCCRYLANDLRIAVEVRKDDDGMVARAEVARAISVLMDDKEMRTRLLKMHGQAHSTLKEGGSSRSNLQILVDSISYHPSQKE